MSRRYKFNIQMMIDAETYGEAEDFAIMAVDSSDIREQYSVVSIELHDGEEDVFENEYFEDYEDY